MSSRRPAPLRPAGRRAAPRSVSNDGAEAGSVGTPPSRRSKRNLSLAKIDAMELRGEEERGTSTNRSQATGKPHPKRMRQAKADSERATRSASEGAEEPGMRTEPEREHRTVAMHSLLHYSNEIHNHINSTTTSLRQRNDAAPLPFNPPLAHYPSVLSDHPDSDSAQFLSFVQKLASPARLESPSRQLLRTYTQVSPTTSPLRPEATTARRSFEDLGSGIGLGMSDSVTTAFPSQLPSSRSRRSIEGREPYPDHSEREGRMQRGEQVENGGGERMVVASSSASYREHAVNGNGRERNGGAGNEAFSPTDLSGRQFPERRLEFSGDAYQEQQPPRAFEYPPEGWSYMQRPPSYRPYPPPPRYSQPVLVVPPPLQPRLDARSESILYRLGDALTDHSDSLPADWMMRIESLLDEVDHAPDIPVPRRLQRLPRVTPFPPDYPIAPTTAHPPFRGRHVFAYETGNEKTLEEEGRARNREIRHTKQQARRGRR